MERTERPTGGATRTVTTRTAAKRRVAAAPPPPAPPRERGVVGRLAIRVAYVFVPLLLLVAAALTIGYVKLSHGSMSLKFLAGPIQRGIEAELGGLKVEIDDAMLDFARDGGVEFRLKKLRIKEPDGDLVASAPLAAAEISLRGLRTLRLVPERVELIEPKLYLFYSAGRGLALAFQRPGDAEGGEASGGGADGAAAPAADAARRLELSQVLSQAAARARRREDASSFLREVALKDATVVFDHSGQRSTLRVPEFALDLEHRRTRSVVSGRAVVASGRGPWSLSFVADESEATSALTVNTSLRDLVPAAVAESVAGLGALRAFDMPVSGDASFVLGKDGAFADGKLALKIDPGRIDVSGWSDARIMVDGGLVNLAYDGASRTIEVQPSPLRFGDGRVTFVGRIAALPLAADGRSSGWRYALRSSEGTFAADEFQVPRVGADAVVLEGEWKPLAEQVTVEKFHVKAGGGEINFTGLVDTSSQTAGAKFDGGMSAMPLATMKALWPRAVAPGARRWVGERVTQAAVKGGTVKFASGRFMTEAAPAGEAAKERLSLAIEAADVVMRPLEKMAPVELPRVLTRLENGALEITAPDAAIVLDKARRVPLKAGKFTSPDVRPLAPPGEINFRVLSPLGPVLDVISAPPLSLARQADLPTEGLEGKVDGQIKLSLPLVAGVEASDIKVEGKAKLTDGRAKGIAAGHDAQGASILFDITEKAVTAQGEMLLAGVLAKINWQRIFDGPADKQPPLRLTATLDNSDRNQLGLDINHVLSGEVPVEVTVQRGPREEPVVRLRADLTSAEIGIDAIAWRKAPGRPAHLQFDIVKGKTHKNELQNLKIAGDDIAVEGWAAIGADNKLREFYFPDVTLNVVSRLEVQGTQGADGVWGIKVRGPTYDGREFFRSLFSVGQGGASTSAKAPKARGGVDLDVEIDNVLGHSETSLKGLKAKVSTRNEKLAALDARGTLDNQPIAAVLRTGPGEPRRLLADSTNAGAAFKLTGFYPNVQGGRVRLEVNVDGKGPAEKTGVLWVEDFQILGDPVLTEVVGGLDAGQPGGTAKAKPRMVRQVFEFDRMRVPFSVGYGQFVMDDSYLRGPVLGASIRGKVDYKTRSVNLGGTYVPLQGLNNALGTIPVLGQLLSGPRGEGIFGITFAIQGAMANPQVIVNPLSLLTPGFTRELMQMTAPDPQIQARDQKPAAAPAGGAARSSSAPAASGGAASRRPDIVDGWNSQTSEPKKK